MTISPFEFSVMVDRDWTIAISMLRCWGGRAGWRRIHTRSGIQTALKNKGSNFVSWSNPAADKLIEEGRRELDEGKRMEIWHKLHKIIADEQPYTFLVDIGRRRCLFSRGFKNTEPYKLGH